MNQTTEGTWWDVSNKIKIYQIYVKIITNSVITKGLKNKSSSTG